MKLYYYHDDAKHKELNARGLDYTPAYIPVFLKNLGFCASEILPCDLSKLTKNDTVIIGADTLDSADVILDSGCNILAFGTLGLGIKTESVKQGGQYDVVGYFSFDNEPLPVLSAYTRIVDDVAPLGKIDGNTAFAKHNNIYYFSFDLPATMLYSSDGKPTLEGKNGFAVGRIPDGCVLPPDYDYNVAYNDSYLRKIEDILHEFGFANIFALPVKGGKVCDLALYFAGDDDAHSAANDLMAAENMHKRGLPYHLNLMPKKSGEFVVTKADVESLKALGCELAIHYDFTQFEYSPDGHKTQMEMYSNAIGNSGGPVNHCLVQIGTAPERYMMQIACGAKYDNNRFQNKVDPNDINAFNLVGYGFGHAFPRFCMADSKNSNAPLQFCEIYMSYYEPRIVNKTPDEYQKIESYLDDSYKYARTSQLFTHPHYISGATKSNPEYALAALDYAKEYVTKKGWNVWYTAPDTLGDWWHARANCEITDTSANGVCINNTTGQKITVVLPVDTTNAAVDGNPATVTQKNIGERTQSLVSIDAGVHKIEY